MADIVLRRCKGPCDLDRPIEMFYRRGPGLPPMERMSAFCYDCRITADFAKLQQKVWDWCSAVAKNAALHVSHQVHKDPDADEWRGSIDRLAVKALYILQQGVCAITRFPLRVPDPREQLPKGATLDTWADARKFTNEERDELPILVRATRSVEWAPGNIVLVTRMIVPVYRKAGSVAGVRALFNSLPIPTIPTAPLIREKRAALVMDMEQAWRAEVKRVAEEELHNE